MSVSSLKVLTGIGCAIALLCGPAHAVVGPVATSWEIAAEFSFQTNLATDLWQYGWKQIPYGPGSQGALNRFTLPLSAWPAGFNGWQLTSASQSLEIELIAEPAS